MMNVRMLFAALFAVLLLAAATSVPVLGSSAAGACPTSGSDCGG